MDFAKVKLRKTEGPRAAGSSGIPEKLICDGENYQELMEETYLERYFELIRALTFRSTFVPLSREAAGAIGAANTRADSGDLRWSDIPELCDLSRSIDSAVAELQCAQVFVRLSSRSPKDAPLRRFEALRQALERELQWVNEDEKGVPSYDGADANQRMHACYRAMTFSMAVRTGREAIDLFALSNRIQGDLGEYVSGKITTGFNVVVREFAFFDPDTELRAFVHDGKLTAITQYNEFVYFPWLAGQRQIIRKLVEETLSKEVLPRVPLRSCVVDILLVRTAPTFDTHLHGAARFADLSVRIVELNPLAEFAGTGLFSWERDRAVLLGRSPFEFRVHNEVPQFALENIPESFRFFVSPAAEQAKNN